MRNLHFHAGPLSGSLKLRNPRCLQKSNGPAATDPVRLPWIHLLAALNVQRHVAPTAVDTAGVDSLYPEVLVVNRSGARKRRSVCAAVPVAPARKARFLHHK